MISLVRGVLVSIAATRVWPMSPTRQRVSFGAEEWAVAERGTGIFFGVPKSSQSPALQCVKYKPEAQASAFIVYIYHDCTCLLFGLVCRSESSSKHKPDASARVTSAMCLAVTDVESVAGPHDSGPTTSSKAGRAAESRSTTATISGLFWARRTSSQWIGLAVPRSGQSGEFKKKCGSRLHRIADASARPARAKTGGPAERRAHDRPMRPR